MNEQRHLFLYAKCWYEKTNTVEDLKKIVAHICGLETRFVQESDIVYWLVECTREIFAKNTYKLADLLNRWFRGDNIIDALLAMMSVMNIDEMGEHIGDPDPKILPLAKHN